MKTQPPAAGGMFWNCESVIMEKRRFSGKAVGMWSAKALPMGGCYGLEGDGKRQCPRDGRTRPACFISVFITKLNYVEHKMACGFPTRRRGGPERPRGPGRAAGRLKPQTTVRIYPHW